MDLDDLDPVALGAALSQLPPTHALVAAARAAVDVADARAEHAAALRDASRDIAAAQVQGTAMRHTLAQRMWAARAEADGPGSAAARVAAGHLTPPGEPAPAVDRARTAVAVAWARQWVDDRAADEADLAYAAEVAAAQRDRAEQAGAVLDRADGAA